MHTKYFVVLLYAPNTCYTRVIELSEISSADEPAVSFTKNTWSFKGREYKIGEMRHCEPGQKYGVIGVYNRFELDHLNAMVQHAQEATKEQFAFALAD